MCVFFYRKLGQLRLLKKLMHIDLRDRPQEGVVSRVSVDSPAGGALHSSREPHSPGPGIGHLAILAMNDVSQCLAHVSHILKAQ